MRARHLRLLKHFARDLKQVDFPTKKESAVNGQQTQKQQTATIEACTTRAVTTAQMFISGDKEMNIIMPYHESLDLGESSEVQVTPLRPEQLLQPVLVHPGWPGNPRLNTRRKHTQDDAKALIKECYFWYSSA